MSTAIKTVNIVGSGNVATHLAKALSEKGFEIKGVLSRAKEHAQSLACEVRAVAVDSVADMPQADLTLVAVPDDAICGVAKAIHSAGVTGVVAHTSGATSVDALRPIAHRGVLYPCMTFSKNERIDLRRCPFLVEAADADSLDALKSVACAIGSGATECDSDGRARLHLAAVLASNFTNHMLLMAQRAMTQAGLPFDLLRPLVEQTIAKAFTMSPFDAQTGPARRNDAKTMERHRELIGGDMRLRGLYDALTASIIKTYGNG